MAKKKQLLPEFLYVYKQEDGADTYFLAFEKPHDAVEDDGPTVVGTYQLTDINELFKRVVSKKL